MKLESVQFKHTALFQDLNLKFQYTHQPITLILGEQSTGKSMLLKHIFHALTWFPARIKDIRTAGVIMPDQDITLSRLQSKIHVQISFPTEIGTLPESDTAQSTSLSQCSWKLFKTLNASGVGISQVETQQLDQMATLYQQATKKDPLQGLPLIAYYPAERFVNEVNLLNKNLPGVTQAISAYDIAAIPFTTFARFFEWLREISDIENARAAHIIQKLITRQSDPHQQQEILQQLQKELSEQPQQVPSPNLYALKSALKLIFPELQDLYLQYQPKLQLMVNYQGQTLPFQQLSGSVKTWIALVGDIVRRLCLLNPMSLYPCLEGEGILLIDQIDAELDTVHCTQIIERLHQAFPRLQMIITGSREELLEHALDYQCLKLQHGKISPLDLHATQQQLNGLYANLLSSQTPADEPEPQLVAPEETAPPVDDLFQQIQKLNQQQKGELLRLIYADDTLQETPLS